AFTHDLLRRQRLEAHRFQLAAEQPKHCARLVVSLLAGDLLHPEPMREFGAGLDDIKQRELPMRAYGAACSDGERAFAFRRLVDDHEEFSLMPLDEDLPLFARLGRLGRLLPSFALLLARHGLPCCHQSTALSWTLRHARRPAHFGIRSTQAAKRLMLSRR